MPVVRVIFMGTTSEPLAKLFTRARKPALRLTLAQRRQLWAYLFVALPFAYFLVVNFYAMANSFLFSFQDYITIRTERTWIGLENYRTVINDPIFRKALKNTLIFAGVRVPIVTVLALGTALLLHGIKRFKGFFRMLYFMPFVTSGVAIAWVFKFLYLPNFGLFTKVFDFFGWDRIFFLGDPRTALPSIIAVTIWASLGYYTIIFLAGLEDIPIEYYEAAMVDGANALQRFWRITLPLLNRTLVLVVVLCLISSLQNFTYVRLLSKDGFGGPLNSTVTMSLLIYKEAFFSLHMGRASAIAVLFFFIVLVATLIQRRLITREYQY
jgi:multiple sugar transport system permease protein